MYYKTCKDYYDYRCHLPKNVDIPIETYKSLRGEYFIGYADNLILGNGKSAWARLYNPPYSGVNLLVNVWTVTDISTVPFRAQFWFNATPPTEGKDLPVTPSNLAIKPTPIAHVRLQADSNVDGEPSDGIKAFVRRGEPISTLVETENCKLIFPPGGSFLVFVSLLDESATGEARIAFGWVEEKLPMTCIK